MITESPVSLPHEEVMGQKLRLHFNHQEITREDEEGNAVISHRYETAVTRVRATRGERIAAILASRYSTQDELALLNNRGARQGEYAGYLAFREQAKALAGGESDHVAAAVGRVNAGYEIAVARVAADYPQRETDTFVVQEREARAWQVDDAALTPFVDALITERGIDKAEIMARIIAKADAYTQAVGRLTGIRQRLEGSIEAASTDSELAAIGWGATP